MAKTRKYDGNPMEESRRLETAELIDTEGNTWQLALYKDNLPWYNLKLAFLEAVQRPLKANFWLGYEVEKGKFSWRDQHSVLLQDPALGREMADQVARQCQEWYGKREQGQPPAPSLDDLI